MSDTMDKVAAIIRDMFEDYDGPVNDALTAEQVPDWDSLAQVKLMVAVESEFGIRFESREINEPANVGELVQMIEKKLAKK
jgi:acyl carrier protein